ncbi:Hypothetical protein, conserved [Brucella intermedia LMG 3301]|uniref:Uncharacterized protein n=1 Tax=Brucella intermedia LMG 3301 TaxID=641118 RepID=C4WHX2_9HYPH|nr:Hypothetical protein, conserved [Brucella intermedia LMG 3301]
MAFIFSILKVWGEKRSLDYRNCGTFAQWQI